MKCMFVVLMGLSLVGSTHAFAPFAWASNKYKYRASVCRASLNAVVRSLTKKSSVKTCMAAALSALGRKNSLLERRFDVQYNGGNKKVRSYDPALKNILMYGLSRRLGVAYLGELPFYSPLKVEDGGRARGEFVLKIGQFCKFNPKLQGQGYGQENVKRLVSGLSHMDFYGVTESYRYTLLQARALQKQNKEVKAAYTALYKWRRHLLDTMHHLISLRRHLEGKANRHTPPVSQSLMALMRDTKWVEDYARVKVATLHTTVCQQHPRACRRDFAAIEQMASAVQSIVDLKPHCQTQHIQD